MLYIHGFIPMAIYPYIHATYPWLYTLYPRYISMAVYPIYTHYICMYIPYIHAIYPWLYTLYPHYISMDIYTISMLYIHGYIPYINTIYPWICTLNPRYISMIIYPNLWYIYLIFQVFINILEGISHCSCDAPALAASGSLRVPPESPGPGEAPPALCRRSPGSNTPVGSKHSHLDCAPGQMPGRNEAIR